MGRSCPHCGSSEIDDDSARGDSTCMGCGTVLEESTIVSDVAFQETSGGGHSLIGQFVSRDRAQPNSLIGSQGLLHQESREITHYKGKKLIDEIASQLRINQHCVETAFNFFRMCVSRNFTRGRVRSHVVAACLYMTCRLENTAHLLLDFSDVTQVNVFDLGRTLNFLARSLKINLPTTDPCLYILRFAVLLDFGDKQKEVVSLATRLVQRMKRDWMATGRRPTGLCGAALVLAARSYNFNRTISDVVRVVHVSEAVVRKRLDEFGQTASSELTVDEFSSVDLEYCEDPPAFREARRKAREQQKKKEEEAIKRIEAEVEPLEEEVEKALEKRRREKFKRTPYARMIAGTLAEEGPEFSEAEKIVQSEIVDYVFDAAEHESVEGSRPYAGISSTFAPSLKSLGITDPLKAPAETNRDLHSSQEEDGELDLSGIDDDEIDSYILTNEESVLKAKFWMKLNGEHLAEMERRRKEREEEEEREKDNPNFKKKRKKPPNGVRKKEPIVAATAQEAMEKVIMEKKLSSKINYDILREVFPEGDAREGLNQTASDVQHSLPPVKGEALPVKKEAKQEAPSESNFSFSSSSVGSPKSSLLSSPAPDDKKGLFERPSLRMRRYAFAKPNVSIANKLERHLGTPAKIEERSDVAVVSPREDAEVDRSISSPKDRNADATQLSKEEGFDIGPSPKDESNKERRTVSSRSFIGSRRTRYSRAKPNLHAGNVKLKTEKEEEIVAKQSSPIAELKSENRDISARTSSNLEEVPVEETPLEAKTNQTIRSRYARARPNVRPSVTNNRGIKRKASAEPLLVNFPAPSRMSGSDMRLSKAVDSVPKSAETNTATEVVENGISEECSTSSEVPSTVSEIPSVASVVPSVASEVPSGSASLPSLAENSDQSKPPAVEIATEPAKKRSRYAKATPNLRAAVRRTFKDDAKIPGKGKLS